MSADAEQQLKLLQHEIENLRRKAQQLRSQAAATDARADAMVKEAAGLQTMELLPVANPLREGQTFPQLAHKTKPNAPP